MTDILDQQQDKLALLEEGCQVMMLLERPRLKRVLARHLTLGRSRRYKSISRNGIVSVTLSLFAIFWLVRVAGF